MGLLQIYGLWDILTQSQGFSKLSETLKATFFSEFHLCLLFGCQRSELPDGDARLNECFCLDFWMKCEVNVIKQKNSG